MNERDADCPQRELAVGWALHCLEPDEEAFFAEHLTGCADCARIVAETQEVGAALALGAPGVDPPPALERRILAAARTAPPAEEAPGSRADAVSTPARRRTRAVQIGLAAAAAVLAVVSVGLGIRVAQLDSDKDDLQAGRAADAALIEAVLDRAADPDVARVAIAAPDGTPMAVMLGRGPEMSLVPVHLPANQPERNHYVLWGLGAGPATALDAFDVSGDVRRVRPVRLGPQAEAFTTFAVSLEPGRTPPASPSEVIASGTVES